MPNFNSLRVRIIVFTTMPLIAILVTTLAITVHSARSTVRDSVQTSLTEAGSVFAQVLTTRQSELLNMSQVTVRDPRFFATFSIPVDERGAEFVPTLFETAADFLRITTADFIELYDADGEYITRADNLYSDIKAPALAGSEGIKQALRGDALSDFYELEGHLVAAAVTPVRIGNRTEGIMRLGIYLDARFIGRVKRLTGTDIALVKGNTEYASTYTLDSETFSWESVTDATTLGGNAVTLGEPFSISATHNDYLAIPVHVEGVNPADGFNAYIGREMDMAMLPILQMEQRTAAGGLLAVLVTLAVCYLVANTITRPLSNLVKASGALRDGRYDYELHAEGKDEVAELTRDFDSMRKSLSEYVQQLKNIDQGKSNFIALAGHELRTPLTIIGGFNEMISSGGLGDIPDSVRETTEVINEHLLDLNHLVQSMLDLTYFEQGLQTFEFNPCDLNTIVRSVVDSRRSAIAKRQLELVEDYENDPATSTVDEMRVSQAIASLVDNAIRFTPDNGRITVRTIATRSAVRVVVEDTGIGIPADELKWIFQKIYEVGDINNHSSGRYKFGSRGFGLGLALAKAIVDTHGGTIEVASTPGRGSTFSIVLSRFEAPESKPVIETQGVLT